MRNFRELEIWKKSMEIVKAVYGLAESLPEREKYVLKKIKFAGRLSQFHQISLKVAQGAARKISRDRDGFGV